jgi:glycosyltransferase involved in cell wall biosynthesis
MAPWSHSNLRFVLDVNNLDALHIGQGLYRYGVDLIGALARLKTDSQFVVFGSQPQPMAEVREIFAGDHPAWTYRQVPLRPSRFFYYSDHLRYGLTLAGMRPDLVHVLAGVVPVLASCPVVQTVHDMMYELFDEYAEAVRSRPYRVQRWMVQHRVKRTICISQTTAQDLQRLWNIDPQTIDVVYHGTSFQACSGVVEKESPPPRLSNPVLAAHYCLEPRKNLVALVRALAQLRPAYPALKLVLYGRAGLTAERERAFNELVEQLQLSSVIEQRGLLSDRELKQLYRDCTIFVCPSLYEGFGLPVLEAMTQGACVVARRASSMAEIIGNAGILIETQNTEELAGAIARLLADRDLRQSLTAAARNRASEFTVQRMARQTYDSYLTAVGRRADAQDLIWSPKESR